MSSFIKPEKGGTALQLLLILAVVLTGASFLYWSWHSGARKNTGEPSFPGSPESMEAAPFTLSDIRGEKFSSSRLKGKPVVLNFFTTWCPSCKEEIPGFMEVYNKYKESDFELVGISVGDPPEALSAYIDANKIKYKILMGSIDTVRAYGGFNAVPMTFFIGKDWKIKNIMAGYISMEVFEREVRKLL